MSAEDADDISQASQSDADDGHHYIYIVNFSRCFCSDNREFSNDFSALKLHSDHATRPMWVCEDVDERNGSVTGVIYLGLIFFSF